MTLSNLIHTHQNKLTATDWDIYQLLLSYNEPSQLTLQIISQECHVSIPTIFRFCQKIGLSGFLELKAMLVTVPSNSLINHHTHLQQSYHQIIDDIYFTDYQQLFHILTHTTDIFLLARSEQELRVAKEFQRIFFPLRKKIFILPNNTALQAQLQLKNITLLIYIMIDTLDSLPIEAYTLTSIYTVMISKINHIELPLNDRIMIPIYDEQYPILTPYILAIEIFYLKFQLYQNSYT